MDTKYEFGDDQGRPIVYVRAVNVAELPVEMRDQAQGRKTVYAVHNALGERLALVHDRNLAFILARQNDMEPVTVH